MAAELTVDGVRQIAALAGLDLDEARAARLLPLLSATMAGLDAVDEADLLGVEPATTFSLERFARDAGDA